MVTEHPGKLVPSDVCSVSMGVTVVVPPRPSSSFELVNGKCYALLVGAAGHVQLGLDHLQPVIGIQGIFRVAERGRLQEHESFDLAQTIFLHRVLDILMRNYFGQALE